MLILADLYNLVPRFVKKKTSYGARVNKNNYDYRRKKRTLKQRNHIHLNIKTLVYSQYGYNTVWRFDCRPFAMFLF